MKKPGWCKYFLFIFLVFIGIGGSAQNPVNWSEKQLMEPAALAKSINSGKEVPVIISVGPGAIIPGSLDNGMVNTKEGLEKLKAQLLKVKKNKKVVIYCGCCPFDRCPNVRPAIKVLKDLKFTHYYLLNLPHNIKTDWIDKNYPVVKS